MSQRQPGILLVNLGTPDAPQKKDVYRYLTQFLTDPRVIDLPWLQRQLLVRGIIVPFRAGNSTRLYQQLWTPRGSPLKYYGEQLAKELTQRFSGKIPVELGMRYQNPSLKSAIESLLNQGVDELIVFPLFPQYASASTGSAMEEVMKVLLSRQVIPSLTLIEDYFDHPTFLELIIERSKSFDLSQYDHFVFSYHGLPQRQLIKADGTNKFCLRETACCERIRIENRHCYRAQCQATTTALVNKLGLKNGSFTMCFQSRLGKDPWIQPYTSEVLSERAAKGEKKLLVFSPSFTADCLETLIEVSVEYQHEFLASGGEKIDLVPSLNDSPSWAGAIEVIIRERVKLPH